MEKLKVIKPIPALGAVHEPPLQSCRGRKGSPPTIGRVCAFDAKIYKNVDWIFDVSACEEGNKKIFRLFYFCSALPSLLVENSVKIVNRQ
jgi:hypothetical protein